MSDTDKADAERLARAVKVLRAQGWNAREIAEYSRTWKDDLARRRAREAQAAAAREALEARRAARAAEAERKAQAKAARDARLAERAERIVTARREWEQRERGRGAAAIWH